MLQFCAIMKHMNKSTRVNHQPAFLLAATPWRENSSLIELFSRDYGRVAMVARSARTRQSELRGVLVPFVPVNASWYGKEELKTLHRAEWIGGWAQPQGRALFSGLYVNELVLKLSVREDPHPEVFEAVQTVMRAVATEANHIAALRRFEWSLLGACGFAPDLKQDEYGQAIESEQDYWLRPEHPVLPLAQAQLLAGDEAMGVVVSGSTLCALDSGCFASGKSLQEALKINRLLLNFRIPEGIRSRQVLQQLQQFEAT